jgi:hypothetical protein
MFQGKQITIVTVTGLVFMLIISGCVSTPLNETTSTPTSTPIPASSPVLVPPFTQSHDPEKPLLRIPTINISSYPAEVIEGTNFTIQFEVSGGTNQENISHAAVHWGTNSGGKDIKDYGRFSRVYTGKVPQKFNVELKAPESGIIYFRAHALINGADLYSNEYEIRIIKNEIK